MSETKIKITNLHKAFGRKVVLDGVDLEIDKGESLVVIGGSGTGKSVLIKCIQGLLTPDEGSILVDEQEVVGIEEEEKEKLHSKMGMLFQGVDLPADGGAAVQADGADAGLKGGQQPDLIGDLNGQLPGGGQDHRLDGLILRIDVLHDGDAVGEGLAGAGGGLGDHIPPGHHGRDAAGLDRGGHFDISFFNGAHDLR